MNGRRRPISANSFKRKFLINFPLEVVSETFGRAALPHWNQIKPSRELQNRASWHSPEAVSGSERQASVTD
jgi:hypothetical protein